MDMLETFVRLFLAAIVLSIILATLATLAGIYRHFRYTGAEVAVRRAEAEAIAQQSVFAPATPGGGGATVYDRRVGFYVPGAIIQSTPAHFAQTISYAPAPALATSAPVALATSARIPTALDLRTALATYRPDPTRLEILMGVGAEGAVIRPFGDDTLHMGFLGASGSGKSAMVQSILTQLALCDPTARRVKFGFIDTEGKTSKPFSSAPHTLWIADDPALAGAAIQEIEAEMKSRATLAEAELAAMPIWAIVLEEYLSLREEIDPENWQKLISIATRARKSRIYLLCASQAFYADNDTRILRGQLRTRTAFAVEDRGTAGAFGIDPKIMGAMLAEVTPGRFVLRNPGGYTIAQAPYIDPSAIAGMFASDKRISPRPGGGAEMQATPKQTIVSFFSPDTPTPDLWQKAITAYSGGARSVRQLAEALNITRNRAEGIHFLLCQTTPPGGISQQN